MARILAADFAATVLGAHEAVVIGGTSPLSWRHVANGRREVPGSDACCEGACYRALQAGRVGPKPRAVAKDDGHRPEVEEASAATGQAVGGSTTSCAGLFRIFPNAAFKKEVKGEQFRALEKQWENVVLLIVDEVSFIGRAFFHRMHCRLQQAIGRSLPKEVSIRRNRQVSATSP